MMYISTIASLMFETHLWFMIYAHKEPHKGRHKWKANGKNVHGWFDPFLNLFILHSESGCKQKVKAQHTIVENATVGYLIQKANSRTRGIVSNNL